MQRTTVSIPRSLLTRAETLAARRRVSVSALLREALRTYLDGDGSKDTPKSLGIGDSGGAGRGRALGDLPDSAYGPGPG